MKIYLSFILLNLFAKIQSLVELPVLEDKSIAVTATAIQNTLNNLFTSLKIQNAKHNSELIQYFTIHKLFISITLRDCNNWRKIASLARVNDIDNKTAYFITKINEVLDEGNNNNAADDIDNNRISWQLEYLKECYNVNEDIINKDDLMKWKYDAINNMSKKIVESKNTFSHNEFWQPNSRRIYKGSRTNIKDFPFMASVQFFGRFQCSGSIIKSDLVITAASCLQLAWNNRFFRENPSFLTVQIGSHFHEHGGETVQILEVYFHPKYDPKALRHNLAVMRLSRKIAFKRSRRVKKINFDRKRRTLFAHDRITIVGWGARDRSNIIYNIQQNKLSYAKLDFIPLDECQEYYTKKYVTKKNFCAGFFTKGGGACNRDVGGPGVIDNMLVGVISFASPVCGAPGPTVFTKLGYYADWIDDIMQQDVPRIAMATTELYPKIYYKDVNTETPAPSSFTPLGDSFTPWEALRKKYTDDLRTGAADSDEDDGSIMSPISSNERVTHYGILDTTSKNSESSETSIDDHNMGATRMEPYDSRKNKQKYVTSRKVTSKTTKKEPKSKSTVTKRTTVKLTRKAVKPTKVKHTSTSKVPLPIQFLLFGLSDINETITDDNNTEATKMTSYLVPSTVYSSKKNKQKLVTSRKVTAKTRKMKQKSKSTVTKRSTVRLTRKAVKRKQVKYTRTSGTPLDVLTTTEPGLNKVQHEDDIEKTLAEIINNLDLDHIVDSMKPALYSNSDSDVEQRNINKQQRGRRVTKRHDVKAHKKRFLL